MQKFIIGNSEWLTKYLEEHSINYENHGWSGNIGNYVRKAKFSLKEYIYFRIEMSKQNRISTEKVTIR